MIDSATSNAEAGRAAVEAYLLGAIDFAAGQNLQQHLALEAAARRDGRISLVFCEHHPAISIGRQGSRAHIRLTDAELSRRKLPVHWMNRGGGCIAHGPGQLCVYAVVPLEFHGWSVGEFLRRFEAGLAAALAELRLLPQPRSGFAGLTGRNGHLACLGVSVKDWITQQGAFLQVTPGTGLERQVQVDAQGGLLAPLSGERQGPMPAAAVRAKLVSHLVAALGQERFHVYSGHPCLAGTARSATRVTRRVG